MFSTPSASPPPPPLRGASFGADGVSAPLASDTAVVHTEYDVASPPPKPAGAWTRFVCISDTHDRTFAVPDGDVLLHAGDLTESGTLVGMRGTVEWLAAMPHKIKIIIAGNHDLTLDDHDDWYEREYSRWHRFGKEDAEAVKGLLTSDEAREARIVYLQDEKHEFQVREDGRTWSVYGSPWSPYFYNWAFNYKRGLGAEGLISKIPATDILLTHGPPAGILDRVITGEWVGCETLTARLPKLKPRLHVFGHIHEAHGVRVGEWQSPGGSPDTSSATPRTVFVNAANFPAGPQRKGPEGWTRGVGQGAFQPVIVDLRDAIDQPESNDVPNPDNEPSPQGLAA
ncbi:metallophosphatase domain-containing protein [Phanerochaete sordida]|uniref:Metallophosphatase domain-containing protein n=1 Tax=Phanerochaete sordida TaxID=48140 RepID=A0A9P3G3T0_9APHY|nr:metallophosphatase domain-containing protein [Phanerochaete sordida]